MTSDSRGVTTETRGQTLLIRLNRHEARNAFDRRQSDELAAAMDLLDDESSLRGAVLSGGPEFFCAGTDLKAVSRGESPVVPGRGYYGMLERPSRKPVIAAVEGFALGGGLELALACDLIVASRSAVFGLPEASHGVLASAGALFRLPQRIPMQKAMEMALTGEPAGAGEMDQLGLINRMVEPGQAEEAAFELASLIEKNAPLSVEKSKEGIRRSVGMNEAESWKLQGELLEPILASEDMEEGISAFREKRAPRWSGK